MDQVKTRAGGNIQPLHGRNGVVPIGQQLRQTLALLADEHDGLGRGSG